MRYEPDSTMRSSRAMYFQAAGFAADGGYTDKWVRLRIGRATLAFPNTAARVRSVRLHDLHHVLTEYETTWSGEGEIAAWEIASGCGMHYAAWLLNFGAFTVGLLIAPMRTFHAFVRGRRSCNLYSTQFQESMLDRTVGELRSVLKIPPGDGSVSMSERFAFLFWSAVSIVLTLLPWAAVGVVAFALLRWLLRP